MISLRIPRSLLTVALAASAALPQYSCGSWIGPDHEPVAAIPPGADSSRYHVAEVHHYAFEKIRADEPITWTLPLAFFWPLIVFALIRWKPKARVTQVIRWLEPVGLAWSAWMILTLSIFGTPLFGQYLALGSLCLLFAIWLWEAGVSFLQWRRARRARAPA